ncbi:MAG TPA: alanine racemase [Candidatus Binatia bacterium]
MEPAFPHGRPTYCGIDHEALRWNLRQIRDKTGSRVKILCMVKANGYGHGAVEISHTLASVGADAFGVATLEEAVQLRKAGIQAPVIVLAGVFPDQFNTFVEYNLIPVIHDIVTLRELDKQSSYRQVQLAVHLKVDTGMGRLGFLAADADQWISDIKQTKSLQVQGVFSHFSHAESVQRDYTRKQLKIFQRVVEQLRSASLLPPMVHLANSAATITLPEAYFDMVRPGLILYGVYPSAEMREQIALKRVLSWKTKILQLKKVPSGASISYGQTFITERESLIATLPLGYADGYPRLLSNRGEALVRGERAPIAGRVCMDLTMLDVTDIRNVRQGDEVVLLGRQGGAEITADEIAAWSNTISYEILTSIGARVPRIHYNC